MPGLSLQVDGLARVQRFMQVLTQHLCDSLYAAAPHVRKHLALRLLHVILVTYGHDAWIAEPLSQVRDAPAASGAVANLPKMGSRRTWRAEESEEPQKAAAGASPLEPFRPLCATLRSPEFVGVRSLCNAGVSMPQSCRIWAEGCPADGKLIQPRNTGEQDCWALCRCSLPP
jgi:hypothetical protein